MNLYAPWGILRVALTGRKELSMTYVVSNLHGHFDEYKMLLRTINFRDDRDVLYVLGDIVDYGPAPMELVDDMSVRVNVYPVAGEHDFTAFCANRRMKKSAVRRLESIVISENGGELRFELCIHLFRRHIRIVHLIIAAVDNAFNRNVPLGFQLFRNHFQDRGFSAATDASQEFDERGIGVCHDWVYI